LVALARAVTPQDRAGGGARRERDALRRVVERQGPPPELADDLAPAARDQVMRLAAERRPGGMGARVAHAQVGMQLGWDSQAGCPQAQVEVFVEQERAGVERPEPAQRGSARGQARGDRPADPAGRVGAPWLGTQPQGPRQQRGMDEGRQQRLGAPGGRVRAALNAAVAV
jgi:hypothetical protein